MADAKPLRRIPADELADYVLKMEGNIYNILYEMESHITAQQKKIKKLKKQVKRK